MTVGEIEDYKEQEHRKSSVGEVFVTRRSRANDPETWQREMPILSSPWFCKWTGPTWTIASPAVMPATLQVSEGRELSSCLFDDSHPSRCELMSPRGFDLHFPAAQ